MLSRPAFILDIGSDKIKYGVSNKEFEPKIMESVYGA